MLLRKTSDDNNKSNPFFVITTAVLRKQIIHKRWGYLPDSGSNLKGRNMKELIEKMAKKAYEFECSPIIRAEVMLSVVLADIKESPERYVKVCDCYCDWTEGNYSADENCQTCHGKGLVAVEQKGN